MRTLPFAPRMMQVAWFTLVGVTLYLVADRLLDAAERHARRRFEYRSVIFFVLLLGMSTVIFALIRRYAG